MPHLYVNGSPVLKHSNTNKGVTEVCVCVCVYIPNNVRLFCSRIV